jgi:hypothetical protein
MHTAAALASMAAAKWVAVATGSLVAKQSQIE